MAGTRVGECAPPFSLPDTEGGAFDSAEPHGVLVVHLTNVEAPVEASLFLSDLDVEAVEILTGVPAPSVQGAVTWQVDNDLTQTVLYDTDGTFGAEWANTSQTPTIIVLDAAGEVLARIHDQYETQLPDALSD